MGPTINGVSIEPTAIYDDARLKSVLEIGPHTLAKSRRSGTLRFVRKGRRILYRGQWVLDWLGCGQDESEAARV